MPTKIVSICKAGVIYTLSFLIAYLLGLIVNGGSMSSTPVPGEYIAGIALLLVFVAPLDLTLSAVIFVISLIFSKKLQSFFQKRPTAASMTFGVIFGAINSVLPFSLAWKSAKIAQYLF